MTYKFVCWLLALFGREKFEIGRKDDPSPYLTRWTLFGKRNKGRRRVFLHCFHRSDADELHDHPWPFLSVILWGGYWEYTPGRKRWQGPFSWLFRPAEWRHRVELDQGRPCWSIVVTGEKCRTWMFYCPKGAVTHYDFQKSLDRGGKGCE